MVIPEWLPYYLVSAMPFIVMIGLIIGSHFWRRGKRREQEPRTTASAPHAVDQMAAARERGQRVRARLRAKTARNHE